MCMTAEPGGDMVEYKLNHTRLISMRSIEHAAIVPPYSELKVSTFVCLL